jgi:hypothetical protein
MNTVTVSHRDGIDVPAQFFMEGKQIFGGFPCVPPRACLKEQPAELVPDCSRQQLNQSA